MKAGKILTLSVLLLALVAIANHQLTQNSNVSGMGGGA